MPTKELDKYEVISFDIFDTLIKRKYLFPQDLFEHLGRIAEDPSFALKRKKAEKKARKLSKVQDITLDEIYKQLPKYRKYEKEEKLLEISNTFVNGEIKPLYDKAVKLNKKIIAVSDMYLDKETISSLLKKAGYGHFDKIYISGEYGKTKWTGDLFDIVIKDLKIEPQKILHIGDNYKNDYLIAGKKGIKTFYYQEKNLFRYKKFAKFSLHGKELEKSCLFSLCDDYYKRTDDYFKRLGFTYGGPLCLSFIEWFYPLLKENNFSDILFISRDGWILKKVFELLYPNNKIKPHYIYAAREICKNVDSQEYKKYLEKQNITGKKIALVDMVAKNYTAHKFLQQFFKEALTGYYFRLMKKNKNLLSYEFEQGSRIYNWDFVEFLITAPEYPAKDIKNGHIVYEEANNFETIRKEKYIRVSQGIIDFINEYKGLYKSDYLQLDDTFIVRWVNNFFFYMTKEDMANFASIYHTMKHDEQDYFPLIPKPFYILFKIFSLVPFAYLWSEIFYFIMRVVNKIWRVERNLRKVLIKKS